MASDLNFTCFADLATAYELGQHYKIETHTRRLDVFVVAPHGGLIERWTDDIAREIACDDLSLHVFQSLLSKKVRDLHITSHLYDEPSALALAARCRLGLGRRSDVVVANMPADEFDQFLDERLEELAPVLAKLPDSEQAKVRDPSWRERVRHNVAAQLVTQPLQLVQHTLSNMGLAIAVIRKPNKSFIIGSHPIIRCEPTGGGNLGTPGVEMWFPVAKDVAISPLPERGPVLVLDSIPDADLRRLNLSIFKQSREIGGCSKELIESLVGAA